MLVREFPWHGQGAILVKPLSSKLSMVPTTVLALAIFLSCLACLLRSDLVGGGVAGSGLSRGWLSTPSSLSEMRASRKSASWSAGIGVGGRQELPA